MKKKLTLGLIIFISLFLCQLTVQAKELETQTVWVTAQDGLNIRTVPRTNGNTPAAAVQYNTELQYVMHSCAKGWILILYEGRLRYVAEDWISFEPIKEQNPEPVIEQPVEEEKVEQPQAQIIQLTVVEEQEQQSNLTFYGSCFITHYCPCSICCGIYSSGYTANGSLATPNWTVAAGSDLPFGTLISINGQTYQVQDRGVGSGCIDIFCSSHEQASARGAYYADVYIVN